VRATFVSETSEGRWQERRWRLAAVEPCEPGGPGQGPELDPVDREGVAGMVAATGPLSMEIFTDEADGYYLNLTSGEPSIFVKWRMPGDESGVSGASGDPIAMAVSLSYNEAGRWMDGGERVDRVVMPAEVAAWLTEFVNLHWEPEKKRKRRGTKPSFMPRAQFAEMSDRERQIMERIASEGPSGDSGTPRNPPESRHE
jgi:hypothetical protein